MLPWVGGWEGESAFAKGYALLNERKVVYYQNVYPVFIHDSLSSVSHFQLMIFHLEIRTSNVLHKRNTMWALLSSAVLHFLCF